jgi:hypothetical protein
MAMTSSEFILEIYHETARNGRGTKREVVHR